MLDHSNERSVAAAPWPRPQIILDHLCFYHRGTDFGDASLRHPTAPQRLRAAAAALELDQLVYLKAEFTNRIAYPADLTPLVPGDTVLQLTPFDAEAFLLDRPRRGVLIANGDCAIGVLSDGRQALVMHLGLDCLWREDGSPTVLHHGVAHFDTAPAQLSLWLGGAIQACCHGYRLTTPREQRRHAELGQRYSPAVLPGRVRHGPRRGAFAVDHQRLAMEIAATLGVGRIDADRRCTACAGLSDPDRPGYGTFYSHTRDHAQGRERNFALVAVARAQDVREGGAP